MQWKKKKEIYKHIRTNGDRRIITRFLFYPREINGIVKWLCFAKIKQKLHLHHGEYKDGQGIFGGPSLVGACDMWVDIEWINFKRKINNGN